MGKNASKNKGKGYEREVCKIMAVLGKEHLHLEHLQVVLMLGEQKFYLNLNC